VARWLRLRTQIPLLIVSFLLSSIYRTVMHVWPFNSPVREVRSSSRGAKGGLLFLVRGGPNNGRSGDNGQRYALELNGSFPFLHVQLLAPTSVAVALAHTPCLSQTAKAPEVNAMQFGFAGPSGGGPSGSGGVCAVNGGPGLQFSSNPLPPSTYVGNPPPSFVEPGSAGKPGGPEPPGCGGCGCDCGCGSCGSACGVG
jgi:hypothetical protein